MNYHIKHIYFIYFVAERRDGLMPIGHFVVIAYANGFL